MKLTLIILFSVGNQPKNPFQFVLFVYSTYELYVLRLKLKLRKF